MSDYRSRMFEEYFESSYKFGNVLSDEQFEASSKAFESDYQSLLPEDRQAAILDFGCGVGDFLYHLKKKGYDNFYGIDVSAQQIDYCKKHITDRALAVDGKEFLHNRENTYDLITAQDVFEHIPKAHVLELLDLMLKALKPGGRIIIRVPNMSNPFGLDARFNDFTHELGFTSKSLNQVLLIAGFKDVRILPPRQIPVRSFKNFVRKFLVRLLHQFLRFCFYIQDYTVPKNLDKNLVVTAVKG